MTTYLKPGETREECSHYRAYFWTIYYVDRSWHEHTYASERHESVGVDSPFITVAIGADIVNRHTTYIPVDRVASVDTWSEDRVGEHSWEPMTFEVRTWSEDSRMSAYPRGGGEYLGMFCESCDTVRMPTAAELAVKEAWPQAVDIDPRTGLPASDDMGDEPEVSA